MYYILLLSQMSMLQFCSESNYAAIFQLNSLSGKIIFFVSDWVFLGKMGKRRQFWIGNGAYIRPLVIGRKGRVSPVNLGMVGLFFIWSNDVFSENGRMYSGMMIKTVGKLYIATARILFS